MLDDSSNKRKRKRKDRDGDLEDAYMQKLAREEAKEASAAAAGRAAKRRKAASEGNAEMEDDNGDEVSADQDADSDVDMDDDSDAASPPPQHETQVAADTELSKASRTVFLSNVSTAAINSKSARKTLLHHLASFFEHLPRANTDEKHKIESIRFRSTAFASAIPKKAAFAKKELMDATTKSTNAYAVYSSPTLAREAAKRLNGTVVLDRHIRVDEVAHPAKTDHKRCVFVGNLGFVDDESNIQEANAEDGREVRKKGKEPADVEEGLWRTFSKCGMVESVRVIRDSKTRVGKGIAYVQFDDGNAVEAALLYNEKKFPPMLPRKLRVTRAKAMKRNAKPDSGRPMSRPSTSGYARKVSGEEASKMGRASKLLGRAAAAQMRKPTGSNRVPHGPPRNRSTDGESIRKPESFVFEGHRASSRQGKSGLKLGGSGKKKEKPRTRSAKRGTAFKAGGGKKGK